MNPDRRTFLSLGVGALAVAAVPAALRRRPPLLRRRIPIMGTVAEIVVSGPDTRRVHEAIDGGFDALRDVERTMSRFRPDSEVGRLNAAAGDWVEVTSGTAHVLDASLRWAEASGGRFDPCLGRVAARWDGVPAGARVSWPAGERAFDAPPRGEPATTPLRVEWRAGIVRARIADPARTVDLGGIAKGYGADQAAAVLRDHGITDGLVNVGGDLVALGSDPAGGAWLIGVRDPDDPAGLATTIEAAEEAIATSGDYVRWFEAEGRRYHHLVDPTTGEPRRTPTRSLTVRADCCMDADAAATALFGAPAGEVSALVARAPEGVRVLHEIQEETT